MHDMIIQTYPTSSNYDTTYTTTACLLLIPHYRLEKCQ